VPHEDPLTHGRRNLIKKIYEHSLHTLRSTQSIVIICVNVVQRNNCSLCEIHWKHFMKLRRVSTCHF